MTVVTRWNPYRELSALQNRMSQLFEGQYGNREEPLTAGAFVPPVDIYEDEHSVQLKLEVPGIDERKFAKDEKEENFRRVERTYGSFTRSFTVPSTVSTEDIKADYEHGVLKVRLSKRAEAKPKSIKVNVGSQPLDGKNSQGQAA